MLTVIVPLFVAVEVLSTDIPTNPSDELVGCVVLFKVISPVLVTTELLFPIIPAVFLADKTIPLPSAVTPELVIVALLLALIPTELSFVTLISPVLFISNLSSSTVSFCAYIPTDDVAPT